MKRNLDTEILDLDGQSFTDRATLRDACFAAVTAPLDTDRTTDTAFKLRLFGLAQTIHAGGVVDLTAEDIALLKQRIGAAFANIIVIGRACELLEADGEPV